MAEVAPEKSRGLKFAEQQLLRHGWEHGKGLGRGENGISEAIKVKVKCDKGGVGHKEGEQFTFHWWDHVFNKASSSLQVESDQNGIQLKKTVEEDEDEGMISNKKPRRAALAKAKLYGCFVKSATLLSGLETPEPKPCSSEDSSSSDEEDDRKLDLSSTTKLSDSDLMKACGGRTAHKGARHGLTMSAKLARLEQQEAEFMAKYGKKTQTGRAERHEETTAEETDVKRPSGDEASDVKPKKKKKKKNKVSEETTEGGEIHGENDDHSNKTKRKHKKKKNDKDEQTPAESSSPEETTVKKKKKKKKCCSEAAEEDEDEDPESSRSESNQNQDGAPKTKKKKKKAAEICEEEEETAVKQKRKKCKKDKTVNEVSHDEETLPPKKKKKKKSKE